jgi:hypothetical protein
MRNSSMGIVAAALLACTASVVAQERPPQVPAERPQVPAERVQPPAEIVVPAPAVTPNRETTGFPNSARQTEPPNPVPRGGKHEDEDQTTPTAPSVPRR